MIQRGGGYMRKRQEGSALIVVLCVMVVTMALSLSLLLAASVSIQNANRANNKEQCRVNAVSVSNVLIEEIKTFRYGDTLSEDTYNYDTMPDEGETAADPDNYKRPIAPNEQLRDKLQTVNTSSWYAYNSSAGQIESWVTSGQQEYTYVLDTEGGVLPGTTKVTMYWVNENEDNEKCPDAFHPEEAQGWFMGIKLYLRVTSTVGEESSVIISCFKPTVNLGDIPVDPSNPDSQHKWASWSWDYLGHEWERGTS